jgi:hypothetical protein
MLLALALAAAGVAGCGGGSSKGTASARSTSLQSPPAYARRFQALRDCLAKHGIVLAKRSNAPGLEGFLGAGNLPKGVSKGRFDAVLRTCAGLRPKPTTGAGANRLNSPAAKSTFSRFVTCMRGHGVPLPPANTSGRGPVFDTKGLNPTGSHFRAAQARCVGILRALVLGQPATGSASPPPGAH